MKFLSKAICCFSLQNLPHMQLAISLSFVKLLWPLVRFISYSHDQDHVHISTTYASTLEVSKISSIHKIKLQVYVWHLSLKNMSRIWGYEKIKDAYPKKVCHMLRHVKKNKKKMHTQRRYATCLGMSKKRAIAPDPKRKERKERDGAYKGVHTPSTKKKYPHTCTSWSRFMTCFSFGSGLWLSKIWEAGMPSNPPYLQLHKNSH